MEIILHPLGPVRIAELTPGSTKIITPQDALDFLAEASEMGASCHILHAADLDDSFFQLSSGLAGEILQKYSNYQLRLAIVGDWEQIESRSLRDFIRESNRGGQVCFVPHVQEALHRLSQ